jgi:hypothetical protein
MSAIEEQTLTNTILTFGYTDVVSFAREQARNRLQQRIAYYQSRIDFFVARYGVQYEVFCQQFHTLTTPSLLERENDSMEWEVAIDAVSEYQHDLNLLA